MHEKASTGDYETSPPLRGGQQVGWPPLRPAGQPHPHPAWTVGAAHFSARASLRSPGGHRCLHPSTHPDGQGCSHPAAPSPATLSTSARLRPFLALPCFYQLLPCSLLLSSKRRDLPGSPLELCWRSGAPSLSNSPLMLVHATPDEDPQQHASPVR